jgi:hypothetical protein
MMIVREDEISWIMVMQVMVSFLIKGLKVGVKMIRAIEAMVGEAAEIFSEAEAVEIGISQISTVGQWIEEITIREVEEAKDMVEVMGAGQDF